ncbi:3-oxoacid CoA-transferase subunit A [Microbacterium sp. BE35]|uniref:CoA transferase subunit A n=1 Tax=Microbacterium sp. BE35 TaxID=2817773 RepID=UPI00285753E4|nr:CoA transferase subunit A [Microbacterium sp. BE35]MDR7188225.1 3-oxoacid CoA-transferase subunit A [Microbacterium sp. BE35]
MDKIYPDAGDAVADVPDGATLAFGGFGINGIPAVLIKALLDAGPGDLEIVSNNPGTIDWGLGLLVEARRVRRMIASYVGENKEFERQYLGGEIEVELTPQGTLAERLRSGGAGIPGFFTPTGAGTVVADGGMPWRYAADGSVAVSSPAKEVRRLALRGREVDCVFETPIDAAFAFVRARKGDRLGNLVFHSSARNFNPAVAMSGRVTIAEVEELVEPGELDPDEVHLPGIYVDRVVPLTEVQREDKRIERLTVRRVEGATP